MNTKNRMRTGCLLILVLLVTPCTSKMILDSNRYILLGEVVKSSVTRTQN